MIAVGKRIGDGCGGRFVAISVECVLKSYGGRGDQNMVMSLMCKKIIINEDGMDREVK